MIFSNPRSEATVENWPSGRNRVTATFSVETNKRGQRVSRVTTGKPVHTTYSPIMKLLDGDDGRIYPIAWTEYGFFSIYDGTMKTTRGVFVNDEEFAHLAEIFQIPPKVIEALKARA